MSTKSKSRLGIRYFDDRILLTDTHAWAYYRVPSVSYEFTTGEEREALATNLTVALAARAVTVINGVSRPSMPDVLQAESVARGRCRAIVRVPWDDLLTGTANSPAALHPQTRLACTALAGVLVSGLAARASGPGNPPPGSAVHVRGTEAW